MLTLHTFGDSVLDSGWYNPQSLRPADLLARNADEIFPEFLGRDLSTRGFEPVVAHHARDGATLPDLDAQSAGLAMSAGDHAALLSVGGNDLLLGLIYAGSLRRFRDRLFDWLERIPIRPVLVATIYDPTFGDDRNNILGLPGPLVPLLAPRLRRRYVDLNDILREAGERYGACVDLHAHFLRGDPSWFTSIIEPSLVGTSEIRRAFFRYWDGPARGDDSSS